jgi:agmatinase
MRDQPVYLTVDLDILDPAFFPGTGTPEPGGIGFDELRQAVTAVCGVCRVVGCDVVELSPPYDQSGASTATACKILRELLLIVGSSN